MCREAPSFNHLLFEDDSLILLKVNEESLHHLRNILKLYEVCSGQTINVDKSSIMFSKNTRNVEKLYMMQQLGLHNEARNEKYLGLPVYVGQSRTIIFAYIKEWIWVSIQGWKEKLLTKVGKEILIKACAQAILTFAMSCSDLTKGLCE